MLHVTSRVFVPLESVWDFRDTAASGSKGVLEASIGMVTASPKMFNADPVNGGPRPEGEISFAASSSSRQRWAVSPLTSPVRPTSGREQNAFCFSFYGKGSCFGFQGSSGRKPAGRRRYNSHRFHPRISPTSRFYRFSALPFSRKPPF
jgi:hypothetical protein